jgi:hypothetical protein
MIRALEGEWSDEHYHTIIHPILSAHLKPARQQALPITRLHDDQFWESCRNSDIYVLDYRSWYLDQSEFYKYALQISNIQNSAIVLFENPFGVERPNIDDSSFRGLLNSRTNLLANLIRSHSNSKIISPAIRIFDYQTERKCLDYFINNRKLFDIYAVHCCDEMDDRNIGSLCSLLNQAMKLYPKPVWVTKWAIPCFDTPVENSMWIPTSTEVSARQMKNIHRDICNISITGLEWFFVGTGTDKYSPTENVPLNMHSNLPYIPDKQSLQWNKEHFLGSADYLGNVKQNILNQIIELNSV